MSTAELRSRRAVVIGASIAGSLAARVLIDHFDEVLLVDRDHFSDQAVPRVTVPQEHHVHLLLQRGRQIMAALYPGVLETLEQAGAEVIDLSHGVKWHFAGDWKHRWPTGITAHYCSRTLVEHTLRQRASALPGVTLREKTTLASLIHDDQHQRITGVTLVDADGHTEVLTADLVIDAGGRGSRAAAWLKSLGYGQVECEEIITKLGYVSRVYERHTSHTPPWQVLLVTPQLPNDRHMAVISPIEDHRYMVTTSGWFGAFPEMTEESFLAYLKALPVSDIHDFVRTLTPVGDFKRFCLPGGMRRHYERMTRLPAGFLTLGDAVCSINPIYSQGMSVSAMQVEALQTYLPAYLRGELSAQQLLGTMMTATETSWQQAKAGDEQFPELGVVPNAAARWKGRYFGWLALASRQNRAITMAMLNVSNLVTDPKTLTHPAMVWRVFSITVARVLGLAAR